MEIFHLTRLWKFKESSSSRNDRNYSEINLIIIYREDIIRILFLFEHFHEAKLKFFESDRVFIIVRGNIRLLPSFLINHSSSPLEGEVEEDSEEGRKVKRTREGWKGGDENCTTWMLARSI